MTLCGASYSWSTNLSSCLFIRDSNKRRHLEKITCIPAEGQGEECIYLGPTQCLASAYFQTPYLLAFVPFYVEKFCFLAPLHLKEMYLSLWCLTAL